jgi:HlyD family secretion protein
MALRRRRIVAIALVSLLVALVAWGLLRGMLGGEPERVAVAGVAVVTEAPDRRDVEEILRYPGTLSPRQTITVVPKVSGRVDRIHVAEGDRVSAGALLVTIDSESVSLQADQAYAAWQAAEAQLRKAERGVRNEELENAAATLAQAEDDFEIAERNLERSKRLFDAGTIPRAKYEEAESAVGAAETTLENARRSLAMMREGATSEDLDAVRAQAEALKAQYDLAALQKGEALVTAPSPGTVAKLLVDPGNLVGPGTALLALVSEHPIHAIIAIPEKHYSRFAGSAASSAAVPKTEVRVYPVAYGSAERFAGTLERVSPLIDPQSRTFTVEATVPNLDGRLRPGMYVNAEIVIDRRADSLTVPESALVTRDGMLAVFVVETGNSEHARMREISVGLRSDGVVEVLGGLEEADRVVTDGNAFLEDGQLVRIIGTR